VPLQLSPEEPEAGPWRVATLTAVMTTLMRNGPREPAAGRPVVIAVDGRSSGGKTTLTARMQGAVPGSAVVHTDDIAWWHSRFAADRAWERADLIICGTPQLPHDPRTEVVVAPPAR
jgi:hypothetical protein